jgi:hypothetical protein
MAAPAAAAPALAPTNTGIQTLAVPTGVPFIPLKGFDTASDRVKNFIHFTEGEANSIYGKINTVSNLLDWILYLLRQYESGNLSAQDIMNLKRYIRTKLAHVGSQMNTQTKDKARQIVDLLDTLVPVDSPPPLDENGRVLNAPAFPRFPYDDDVTSEDPDFSTQLLMKNETPEIRAQRAQALRGIMNARTAQRDQLQAIKDATDGTPKGPRYQAILGKRQKGGKTKKMKGKSVKTKKVKKVKKGKKAMRKTRH